MSSSRTVSAYPTLHRFNKVVLAERVCFKSYKLNINTVTRDITYFKIQLFFWKNQRQVKLQQIQKA